MVKARLDQLRAQLRPAAATLSDQAHTRASILELLGITGVPLDGVGLSFVRQCSAICLRVPAIGLSQSSLPRVALLASASLARLSFLRLFSRARRRMLCSVSSASVGFYTHFIRVARDRFCMKQLLMFSVSMGSGRVTACCTRHACETEYPM